MPSETEHYLTRQQLAERTGLSLATIQRLKEAGRIRYFQPSGKGGRVLFPPDAIERMELPAERDGGGTHALAGPRPAWQRRANFRST